MLGQQLLQGHCEFAEAWNFGPADEDARPVRWIVARLGDDVIPFSFAGVESGTISRGHRILGGEGELDVDDPLGWLRGILVAQIYTLYTWFLWPVLLRSLLRQLSDRGEWAKTEREPLGESATAPAEPAGA